MLYNIFYKLILAQIPSIGINAELNFYKANQYSTTFKKITPVVLP